jgi:hypothetical protein
MIISPVKKLNIINKSAIKLGTCPSIKLHNEA